MSDCFDHEVDAWESLDRAFEEGYRFGGRSRTRYAAPAPIDHLFYHKEIEFESIVRNDGYRYLVNLYGDTGVWVPIKICRSVGKRTMFVHSATYSKLPRVSIEEQDPFNDFEVIE